MENFLDELKNCHEKIKKGFYSSEALPSLEEQMELLSIAQTCIDLSKTLTHLRILAKEKIEKENSERA